MIKQSLKIVGVDPETIKFKRVYLQPWDEVTGELKSHSRHLDEHIFHLYIESDNQHWILTIPEHLMRFGSNVIEDMVNKTIAILKTDMNGGEYRVRIYPNTRSISRIASVSLILP
jgi:hypothetical protein